jgi:hypothetical protein
MFITMVPVYRNDLVFEPTRKHVQRATRFIDVLFGSWQADLILSAKPKISPAIA